MSFLRPRIQARLDGMVARAQQLTVQVSSPEMATRPETIGPLQKELGVLLRTTGRYEEYRRLVKLRRSSEALARGGFRYVHVGADALAYLRETKEERLLCLAARAPHEPIAVPFAGLETVYGDDAVDGVLPSHGPAFHVWRVVS